MSSNHSRGRNSLTRPAPRECNFYQPVTRCAHHRHERPGRHRHGSREHRFPWEKGQPPGVRSGPVPACCGLARDQMKLHDGELVGAGEGRDEAPRPADQAAAAAKVGAGAGAAEGTVGPPSVVLVNGRGVATDARRTATQFHGPSWSARSARCSPTYARSDSTQPVMVIPVDTTPPPPASMSAPESVTKAQVNPGQEYPRGGMVTHFEVEASAQ
jgi:hypothetical protein